MIRNSIIKLVSLSLIIGLNWAGISAISETLASFNDTETSSENTFSAAMLDFSLTNPDVGGFIGVELGEDIEFLSVVTKTTGSLDIQYKAHAEKISGNDNFCNALKLEVFHSAISYDGALLSFDTATTTALGTWAFEVKLPHTASNFAHGEQCNVDFVFEGWRKDVADSSQSGFTDEERIQLRLVSRMIVLNEFLPNPEGYEYGFDFGKDHDDMPQGEWVELYNNGDTAVDVTGWYLRDSTSGEGNKTPININHILAASPTVPAHGWLVVYMNKPIYNNTGDTVKLFDNTDRLVDSYTYTTSGDYCDIEPTPGDENSTDTSGSCAGVPPNKSYARIPDGIGAWVDPIPTPGRPNILYIEITGESVTESVVEDISTITEEATTTPETISETQVTPIPAEEGECAPCAPPSGAQEGVQEIPPATEENPPVIEQAPVQKEPVPPPPPLPLEPSDEGLTGQAEPELSPTPDPNL